MQAPTLRGYSVIITLQGDSIFIIKIMASPIWQDYGADMGSSASVEFRILDGGGSEIYRGKSYRRPGGAQARAYINDICADYLDTALPVLQHQGVSLSNAVRSFTVQYLGKSGWVSLPAVTFVKDYSYDYGRNYSSAMLSSPINGRADARQWLMATMSGTRTVTFSLRYKDGATTSVTASTASGSGAAATGVIDLSRYQGLDTVSVGSMAYKVAGECYRHVLYYLNSHGGWDSLLMEGLSSEADDVERFTAGRHCDNSDSSARGIVNYLNEIEKNYTLRTGWLSDDEAARMHEVMNSTDVYLFDLGTRVMRPVILTDTTTEYKTYRGNGNRLVNYSLTAHIAQEMERR